MEWLIEAYDDSIGERVDCLGRAVLPLHADAQCVYVSDSEGNDANDGLTENTPKKTIAAGYSLIRDGFGDHLCLRAGDTWTTGLGDITKAGRSAVYPLVTKSYGIGDRPMVTTDGGRLFTIGVSSPTRINYLAFVDLQAEEGFAMLSATNYFLVENCIFRVAGFNFQPPDGETNNHIVLRMVTSYESTSAGTSATHCVLFGGQNPTNRSTLASDYVTIEDCCFDQGGWGEDDGPRDGFADVFSQNVYFQYFNGYNFIFRRNISSRASATGLQARNGGQIYDNVFIDNPIALLFGAEGDDAQTYNPNGITGNVYNNLFIGADDIDSTNKRGIAIEMQNVAFLVAENNVILNDPTSLTNSTAFKVTIQKSWAGVTATIQNNVSYNWNRRGDVLYGGSFSVSNSAITTESNEWDAAPSGTNVDSALITYTDTARTVGSYHATLGGTATVEGFMLEAREKRTDSDYGAKALRDYIFAGFDR